MPNNQKIDKNLRNKLRIAIFVCVGVIAFAVSISMNIKGMKAAINKESDSSGMAGISVRTSEKNSFENTKKTKVNNEGNVVEEDYLIGALPIINLNNNNWDRIKARFSGFEIDENGNAVFEDGYTLYCNGTYVNYVVFNEKYKGEIVGHIKLGTELNEIKEKLGEPTYEMAGCIGYKTREVYVFFYQDEVAVYPNKNMSNKEIELLFNKYLKKIYEKGRTYFLVDIRNNFKDFTIEQDVETNTVILTSTSRQVKAKLDSLGNIEVEFYNGYKFALEETKEYIKQKKYLQSEEDLVQLEEYERVSGK